MDNAMSLFSGREAGQNWELNHASLRLPLIGIEGRFYNLIWRLNLIQSAQVASSLLKKRDQKREK